MKTFKIVTVADSKYFDLVKVMIKSAVVNFPEASAYVELVNMGLKETGEIKCIQPNSAVNETKIDFENVGQKQCYCGNRVATLLYELRLKCDDILVWVDADMIFRKSCKELVEIMSSCDIAACRKPGGNMIRTAIFSFNNTKAVKKFASEYAKKVELINNWRSVSGTIRNSKTWKIWMADTTVFTNLCDNLFKNKLKLVYLDDTFCDVTLDKASVIWNGLSKNKRKTAWLKESRKFRK